MKPVVQENIGATCGLIAGINRTDCVMLWLCVTWQILRVYWHLKYNKNDFLAIGSPAVHVHDEVQVHLFRFLQLTALGLTFLFTPAALINCFPVKHLCSCTMQQQLACFNSNSWAVTMQMNNYSIQESLVGSGSIVLWLMHLPNVQSFRKGIFCLNEEKRPNQTSSVVTPYEHRSNQRSFRESTKQVIRLTSYVRMNETQFIKSLTTNWAQVFCLFQGYFARVVSFGVWLFR